MPPARFLLRRINGDATLPKQTRFFYEKRESLTVDGNRNRSVKHPPLHTSTLSNVETYIVANVSPENESDVRRQRVSSPNIGEEGFKGGHENTHRTKHGKETDGTTFFPMHAVHYPSTHPQQRTDTCGQTTTQNLQALRFQLPCTVPMGSLFPQSPCIEIMERKSPTPRRIKNKFHLPKQIRYLIISAS